MCISPSLPPINPFIYLQTTNPYLIHIHALYEGYLGLTFLLSPPKNLDRAAADITQLLRRFENILAFESVRLFFFWYLDWEGAANGTADAYGVAQGIQEDGAGGQQQQDRNAAAVGTYQMEVETSALV